MNIDNVKLANSGMRMFFVAFGGRKWYDTDGILEAGVGAYYAAV